MESSSDAAPRTRPRPAPRYVVAREVHALSPRMRRITFAGDDLRSFAWSGPAAHIKIVFPEPGRDELPAWTPDGPRPATMRTYTPRRFDPESHQLVVDFVLHGAGPASLWAAQATPGQRLIILGPGRGYDVDTTADWYVLAGDDAALPAIETLLEAIPSSAPVTVFLEMPSADERRALPGNADVRWLTRGSNEDPGSTLHAALAAFAWPHGNGRVYVGCEADAMRRIRREVVASSGLDPDRVVTRGYWRIGERNHPDHDYARE